LHIIFYTNYSNFELTKDIPSTHMKNNITTLLQVDDMGVAKEIQALLEESGIYCLLISDNPASSIINVYGGFNPAENVTIQINESDFQAAAEIITNSLYKDLLTSD
jgi:transcription antitermination factor NusA-like protein